MNLMMKVNHWNLDKLSELMNSDLKGKWISVKERLPPLNQYVLTKGISGKLGYETIGYYQRVVIESVYYEQKYGNNEFYSSNLTVDNDKIEFWLEVE